MISGNTKLAGFFASPAKHSLSPLIHNEAFKQAEIDAAYLAFDIDEAEFPSAIASIRALDMLGVNLSMPYKMKALKFVDHISEEANLIGSINTIVNRQGILWGHNTDGIGLLSSLHVRQVPVKQQAVVVLGTGGAALAIIVALAQAGASSIHVFNRKSDSNQKAQQKLANIAKATNCQIAFDTLDSVARVHQSIGLASLLVNATSVGMSPNEAAPLLVDPQALHNKLTVVDIIYQPRQTKLLQAAEVQGCQTINGLDMLFYQAAAAFELWTGQPMDVAFVKKNVQTEIE